MISEIKHPHDTGAYKYADMVTSGEIIAGKLVVKAAERFLKDLTRDDIYLDLERARKIVNFAGMCRHYKGSKAGQAIILEPHQEFYFQQLFGWINKETGLRRFRRSVKLVARKQYKTTELAIQANYHCLVDCPNGPQVYIAATKEDQARICLTDAMKITEKSEIGKFFKWASNNGRATRGRVLANNGVLGTIGRDSNTSDGLDVSMSCIDEWHEHKNTSLRDILSSGMGNREEPLESIISTAGFNLLGPCYSVTRKNGIEILDGLIEDDSQLVLFYEMDEPEDWENQDKWIMPNPNLNHSKSAMPFLLSEYKNAKNEGGSTLVNFKTKLLNLWVDSPQTWIESEILRANAHGVSDEELIGKDCYVGLDLSAGKDLNAASFFFPDVRPGVHAVKMMYWIPRDKLDYSSKDGQQYIRWNEQGLMRVFDNNVVVYEQIAMDILNAPYNIIKAGADPKYLYTGPVQFWNGTKIQEVLFPVAQGFSLSGATESVATWSGGRELDLMNNPVLLWNFSNVVLHKGVSGHIYPSKGKSLNKIDGVSALVTGCYLYLLDKVQQEHELWVERW